MLELFARLFAAVEPGLVERWGVPDHEYLLRYRPLSAACWRLVEAVPPRGVTIVLLIVAFALVRLAYRRLPPTAGRALLLALSTGQLLGLAGGVACMARLLLGALG